jgi:predicted ribonuclease toxin of YeeF-YezG toxin-antitoxin module
MALMKMSRNIMSTVSKIKDVCEDILDEMKALIKDFANLEGAFKDV